MGERAGYGISAAGTRRAAKSLPAEITSVAGTRTVDTVSGVSTVSAAEPYWVYLKPPLAVQCL